jgi:hypothetical protein
MTKTLTYPSFLKKKIYYVELATKVRLRIGEDRNGVEVDGEILRMMQFDYTRRAME